MYYEPYVLCHYGVKGMKWYQNLKAKRETERRVKANAEQNIRNSIKDSMANSRIPEARSTQTQRNNYARLSAYKTPELMRKKDPDIKKIRNELKSDRKFSESYQKKFNKQLEKAVNSKKVRDSQKLDKMRVNEKAKRVSAYKVSVEHRVNELIGEIGDSRYRSTKVEVETRARVTSAIDNLDKYIVLNKE